MANPTEQGVTRREFLVRSATIAGGAFLSIGVPPGSARRRGASRDGRHAGLHAVHLVHHDARTARPRCTSSRPRWASTSAPASRRSSPRSWRCTWDNVRLDTPLESVENFAIYGLAYTVNSGSVTTEFDRISRAGALGRIALIEAGAKLLGAKLADCYAENGRVIDKASGRSIGYGEILQKVKIDRKFAYPDDFKKIKLKDRSQYKIIGKSVPALDIPAKTNGQAKYGIDVFLPEHGLRRAGDAAHALRLQGAEHRRRRGEEDPRLHQGGEDRRLDGQVHRLGGGAGGDVPGRDEGRQGAQDPGRSGPYGKLEPRPTSWRSSPRSRRTPQESAAWVLEGDVDKALPQADKVLEMEYTSDMVCHATMEPINCDGAAFRRRRVARLHRHAEHVVRAHDADRYLSKVLNKKPEDLKVYVHQYLVGGGFGGKQDYDEILAAAYCVKEIGRPVKLIQTRESHFATSFPRTPTYPQAQGRHQERPAASP